MDLLTISSVRAKEDRWRAGMSAKVAANHLDYSERQLLRYEAGHTPLTVNVIDRMADLYGVTWGWFFRC